MKYWIVALCITATSFAGNFSMAQPSLLLDGFSFSEGPANDNKGNLYFSDIPNQRVYVYYQDKLTVFLDNSGGANGLYFDSEGTLHACAGKDRQLIKVSGDGEKTVLADSFDGKKLNSPNDLWIDYKDGIYFTDPRYGNRDNLEQDGMHVYYLKPEGELIRVIDDMVRPNGIVGTDDGKFLYVVDQGVEKTYRYKIKSSGLLGGKKEFAPVGSDGLSTDKKGNVYITNGSSVEVYNYAGENISTISFSSIVTNLVWTKENIYFTTQSGEVYQMDAKEALKKQR